MTRFVLATLAACLVLASQGLAETDDQVTARSDVLDLAGAFQNDGFKIRDGNFLGQISKDHSQIVAVNLYSGNAYWFTASTGQKSDKLKVSLFDDPESRSATCRTKQDPGLPPASARMRVVYIT